MEQGANYICVEGVSRYEEYEDVQVIEVKMSPSCTHVDGNCIRMTVTADSLAPEMVRVVINHNIVINSPL